MSTNPNTNVSSNENVGVVVGLGLARFDPRDVTLLENMVTEIENRMPEDVTETIRALQTHLQEAIEKQDQMESYVKKLSTHVSALCKSLQLEPPTPFEVFGAKSLPKVSVSQENDGRSQAQADSVLSSSASLKRPFEANQVVENALLSTATASQSTSKHFIPIPAPTPIVPLGTNTSVNILRETPKAVLVHDVAKKDLTFSAIAHSSQKPAVFQPLEPKVFDVVDHGKTIQKSPSSASLNSGVESKSIPQGKLGPKQTVFLKGKPEASGIGFEASPLRVFNGLYELDHNGTIYKIRFSLVRFANNQQPMELMVCFPFNSPPSPVNGEGQENEPETVFGFYEVTYSFLDKDGQPVVSDSFKMEAGDGTCILEDATPEGHIQCSDATWTIEVESAEWLKKITDHSVNLKQLKNQMQAYYFNVSFDLKPCDPFALEGEGIVEDAVAVPQGRNEREEDEIIEEVIVDPAAFHAPLEELGTESLTAFLAWRCEPNNPNHKWFHDVDINIELLFFSREHNLSSLTNVCAGNLMKIPPEFYTEDLVNFIQELVHEIQGNGGNMPGLVKLDRWASNWFRARGVQG